MCTGYTVDFTGCEHFIHHWSTDCGQGCSRPIGLVTHLHDCCAACEPAYQMQKVHADHEICEIKLKEQLRKAESASEYEEVVESLDKLAMLRRKEETRIKSIPVSRALEVEFPPVWVGFEEGATRETVIEAMPGTGMRQGPWTHSEWIAGKCIWSVGSLSEESREEIRQSVRKEQRQSSILIGESDEEMEEDVDEYMSEESGAFNPSSFEMKDVEEAAREYQTQARIKSKSKGKEVSSSDAEILANLQKHTQERNEPLLQDPGQLNHDVTQRMAFLSLENSNQEHGEENQYQNRNRDTKMQHIEPDHVGEDVWMQNLDNLDEPSRISKPKGIQSRADILYRKFIAAEKAGARNRRAMVQRKPLSQPDECEDVWIHILDKLDDPADLRMRKEQLERDLAQDEEDRRRRQPAETQRRFVGAETRYSYSRRR